MDKTKKFLKYELTGWKTWEIVWMVFAISVIISLSLHWGDNVRGIIAAVTGVMCVILTGKGKMSCFMFGLVNTILYAWIAFEARYYGEVMLNGLYYAPMQFVGWLMWKKHMNNETKEVEKTKLNINQEIMLLIISIICIYGYGTILRNLGGNLPFFDSISTCLSIVAMILSVRRLMEQWIIWIVVDLVTVNMWLIDYFNGGTDIATLLMWIVYLLNAIFMFIKWFKESR
ncbi:nicotinamide mononucleotide transporter [Vallitalea longa]|uniref:Nicotinamide mononucleotide transporter n=1 Tax=Vallitalea longa TaxID=2936439 RepID=A0A9W6DDX5_9FIRM|nr:nicotinamide riboside transporter PnuC [Vallitalea longa]GKX28845.1 nicotinamide mononucleotide transporter [Vallitalea longa]